MEAISSSSNAKSDQTSRQNAHELAARLMETVPLIMYYIRSNVLRHGESPATLPQTRALAFIKNCPGSSLSRLAESLAITPATASAMVDKLVKAGLINRTTDPSDRRNIILSLTSLGEERLQATRSIAIEEISQIIAELPAQQQAQMKDTLATLKDLFTEANDKLKSTDLGK